MGKIYAGKELAAEGRRGKILLYYFGIGATMENNLRVGIGDFVRDSIRLSDAEFEKAMRLDNNDKDINDIEIIALTKEAIECYERS